MTRLDQIKDAAGADSLVIVSAEHPNFPGTKGSKRFVFRWANGWTHPGLVLTKDAFAEFENGSLAMLQHLIHQARGLRP